MNDLFDLSGQRALITGGSRGLGREMVLALAGADIALVARPSEALAQTAEDIRAKRRTVWTGLSFVDGSGFARGFVNDAG